MQLGSLGERCELTQRSLERNPSRNRIRCTLALKYDIWWHHFARTVVDAYRKFWVSWGGGWACAPRWLRHCLRCCTSGPVRPLCQTYQRL